MLMLGGIEGREEDLSWLERVKKSTGRSLDDLGKLPTLNIAINLSGLDGKGKETKPNKPEEAWRGSFISSDMREKFVECTNKSKC
ncbi:hypothetical protein LAZ67_6003980 [Cordylochernes scorpioides]|uniref:Uncharacterized protein n=1 Tax=Cordylochernes scorpioides TaxID=51811 RepID=A0ABY6KLP2_9ARAC|nr:hypothetical protein LAZ67_6003980 [Cordylochernes scorpioides]